MTIIKTLLLQAFLLLAFLGAAQGTLTKPVLTTDPQIPDCATGLKLICTEHHGQVGDTPSAEMKFQKDGEDIKAPLDASLSTWQAVTAHAVSPNTNKREGVLSTSTLNVSHYGAYTCLSKASNGDISEASQPTKIECTGCSTNTSCEAHDEHSYCNAKKCTCKIDPRGTYGECKECDANSGKGCPDNNPRCDSGECKPCVEKSSEGCTGNRPYCKTAGQACEKCDTKTNEPCLSYKGLLLGAKCQNDGSCKVEQTTSAAGTVTSTACLVIASVVVALMI